MLRWLNLEVWFPAMLRCGKGSAISHCTLIMKRTVIISLALLVTSLGQAATFVIDSHSAPWEPSVNPAYAFGVNDDSGPTLVPVSAGDWIIVGGAQGLVSAGPPYWPYVGPDGQDGSAPWPYVTNDGGGSSGTGFPSRYTPSDWDSYLMALMGTFTDSSGVIVGAPFEIGSATLTLGVPTGASYLQLGINDDIFADNVGGFSVDVSLRSTGVPDGGVGAIGLGSLVLIMALLRRRVGSRG